ncbi:MAG: hypothetical protein GC168_18630 [Candidatus Hydrogenedens sp.]|nr:hypothetical protein [Candidatus Hydrogenedens sp.]
MLTAMALRRVITINAVAALLIFGGIDRAARAASEAHGGGGGGQSSGCVWEQDLTLTVEGRKLQVSQDAIKTGKLVESGGYFIHPDPKGLFIFIKAPTGKTYRAGLTILQGKPVKGSRELCTAYFAGRPIDAGP